MLAFKIENEDSIVSAFKQGLGHEGTIEGLFMLPTRFNDRPDFVQRMREDNGGARENQHMEE
jgi:hypothetical protein